MFGNGARLDDIMNILKPPTLDNDDDKKNQRIPDAAIRYVAKKSLGEDTINLEFAGQKNSEVLK